MQIGPDARSKGFRAIRFETLASTNDEAMDLARSGEPSGLWVLADEQTRGRGRHGRPWSSPRGNFHGSLLLVDPCAQRFAPQLGFVAGVSLLQALRALAPDAPISLKWPNDLLLAGAKLAGVLVEGASLPARRFACVIGFGVNCAAAPDGLPYPATSLAGSGIMGTSGDLLPRLSDAVSSNLELWRSGEGFSAIRSAWLAGANGLGHMLEARTNAGALRGVFETIDEHGRLVLATDAGRQTIEAGDIFPVMQSGVAADRT